MVRRLHITYLFWDIDGTLLSTARAGIFALEDACREVLGADIDLAATPTAGLTDAEIAVQLCQVQGVDDPAVVDDLMRSYERLLPERLGWRRGTVLRNVRDNLDWLSRRPEVVNMLLTGNVARGARAKLEHYGLWGYFAAGGAFSVAGSDRPAIARRARDLAAAHAGGRAPGGEHMVVIGDTPHDVACGKAIGARTVAIASGPQYTLAELESCEPWRAFEFLPAPEDFGALLDLG